MQPAKWAKGRVVLTTAHLCKCDPPCAIPEHVKAMCNSLSAFAGGAEPEQESNRRANTTKRMTLSNR